MIEPNAASAFAAKLAEEAAERAAAAKAKEAGDSGVGSGDKGDTTGGGLTTSTVSAGGAPVSGGSSAGTGTGTGSATSHKKTMFFGSVELDPIKAKLQFSDVADEVLMLFTQKPGVKVRISVEIEAESPSGFDDGIQRSVRENCDQLKFKNRTFDE